MHILKKMKPNTQVNYSAFQPQKLWLVMYIGPLFFVVLNFSHRVIGLPGSINRPVSIPVVIKSIEQRYLHRAGYCIHGLQCMDNRPFQAPLRKFILVHPEPPVNPVPLAERTSHEGLLNPRRVR